MTEAPWAALAARAEQCPIGSVAAAWRALNYLAAAQLYLRDHFDPDRPLTPDMLKTNPAGHWGVCPPVNLMLAHLGPLDRAATATGRTLLTVHGAGHAGPAAWAHAYLTGAAGAIDPRWRQSRAGLGDLIASFPHTDRFGPEISPYLPGQVYMGGQLGGALAFAQGAVLDRPDRLAVPLIGDGECETGATAAAWPAASAFTGTGRHGAVLPVVLLNGMRMGGASLLADIGAHVLAEHLAALGYRPRIVDGRDHATVRGHLHEAVAEATGAEYGPGSVLICTLPKGHTGPERVGANTIAGTPRVHKTPLRDPATDPAEREALHAWLMAYEPAALFDADGRPSGQVRDALPSPPRPEGPGARPARLPVAAGGHRVYRTFSEAVTAAADRAIATGVRVFSPDELHSNRLPLTGPAVVEVLNEELCHLWAQGRIETGAPALVIGYEAFAPIAGSLLAQHRKYRAVAARAGRPPMPNVVYLVTSLGWHNSYSHQQPGLATSLATAGDGALRLLLPADATRLYTTVTRHATGAGQCCLITATKHPLPAYPAETIETELAAGAAHWPHLSDHGDSDIVLAAAGDLAAREVTEALALLRRTAPGLRVKVVYVHDLTALGHPDRYPHALNPGAFTRLFGDDTPVLLATILEPAATQTLLWDRPSRERFTIVGYRDPGRPLAHAALLAHTGLAATNLAATATRLASARATKANR